MAEIPMNGNGFAPIAIALGDGERNPYSERP